MRTAICLFLVAVAAAACSPTEEEVRQEIQDANHCDVPTDCVNVGGRCPFGCDTWVNAAEEERILDLIEEYRASASPHCDYSCEEPAPPDCVEGECVSMEAAGG